MNTLIVFLFFVVLVVSAKHLPHRLSKLFCAKSVPNYEKCMRETLQDLLPTLFDGVPELDLPPMSPLKLSQMNINSKFGGFGKVNGTLKNIVIEGIPGMKVDALTIDIELLNVDFKITIPFLRTTMKYDIDATIMQRPFRSKGAFKGKLANVQLMFSVSFKRVSREDVEYFEVDNFDAQAAFREGKIELITEDLTQQETADYLTNMFNKNFQTVMELVTPFLEVEGTEAGKDLINYYVGKAPAQEWMPE